MKKLFEVRSKFDRKDYNKYLQIATFKGKALTLPFLILVPLILSVFIAYFSKLFNIKTIVFLYIPFLFLAFAVVFLKLKLTQLKLKLMDTSKTFDTYNRFSFYEDRLLVENEKLEGQSSTDYKDFYSVLETKDYFIVYLSELIVTIIKKEYCPQAQELSSFLESKVPSYRKV